MPVIQRAPGRMTIKGARPATFSVLALDRDGECTRLSGQGHETFAACDAGMVNFCKC